MQGGVGLGIEVQHQRPVAGQRQSGRKVDGRGGLANSTLLVEHRDPSHRSPSVGVLEDRTRYRPSPVNDERSEAECTLSAGVREGETRHHIGAVELSARWTQAFGRLAQTSTNLRAASIADWPDDRITLPGVRGRRSRKTPRAPSPRALAPRSPAAVTPFHQSTPSPRQEAYGRSQRSSPWILPTSP